jgi:AraC family transcriptional regulator
MRSSAHPVIIAEDDYASGAILCSGTDKHSALSVRRTRINVANPDVALSWGYKPGYVARLHLIASESCTFTQGRRHLAVPPRRPAETCFRDVCEPCIWPVVYPIDQLRFELPEAALARWLEDHRLAKRAQLDLKSGSSVIDNTLLAFGRAALATLEQPEKASQFFIDHILTGLCAYMFEAFTPPRKMLTGGLAPWQERRARDMIESRLGSDLSLDELACECGLSVAHFTRAFRQSVGETPHRWLMQRRVDTAQRLLISTAKPLAQIAAECGFADQAHFTNIFARLLGAPPGKFRRERNATKNWPDARTLLPLDG